MRTRTIVVIVIVILVLGFGGYVALARNNKDDPMTNMSPNSSDSSSSSQAVATNSVKIQNFAFSPASITVKVGTKVTWTNQDSTPHTVTADTSSSNAPSSDQLAQGQSYSFTFTKAGTYAYHCSIHPDMTAKVTVTE